MLLVITSALSLLGNYVSGISDVNTEILSRWTNGLYEQLNVVYNLSDTAASANSGVGWSEFLDIARELLNPLGVVLHVLLMLAATVLSSGAAWFWLKMARGKPQKAGGIFSSLKSFTRILLLDIVISIFVLLWSLLLIIPGIIAALRYSQAIYIALEHPEYSIRECIAGSKELMKGRKGTYFILELSFLGWMFVGSFIYMMIGYDVMQIFLLPYMGVTNALWYINASETYSQTTGIS